MRKLLMILLVVTSSAAAANAPYTSLRPVARPGTATDTAAIRRVGLFESLRPKSRDRKSRAERRLARKGAVCGDIAIQGIAVGRVPGRIKGCGIDGAVKVRSVSGVTLSQQAVMDCATARALKSWIDRGLKPAVGKRGGGIARLRVAAHYACRTRNGRKGARISEHGKGRAIDISAITLRDGNEISVLKHWGRGKNGRILKKMHRAACGPFGTVLGPNADRYHRDHFHFDTARYRSGSYCR
ncbi:extensin family protein [Roseovarius sp. CAU 1744]|uniref:extensin-like domain-containing protein n=1 Tax=Roseovarius sp. CAU 1744 TaxID=3140368 RepID=UPI00325A5F1C